MIRPDSGKAEPRDGESARRPMCSKKERALLLPYALTGCRPDEGITFEAHLLDCDACFADLKVLDKAAVLIGDNAVARLILADLFYNAPLGSGPNDRLEALLASIPAEAVQPQSKQA